MCNWCFYLAVAPADCLTAEVVCVRLCVCSFTVHIVTVSMAASRLILSSSPTYTRLYIHPDSSSCSTNIPEVTISVDRAPCTPFFSVTSGPFILPLTMPWRRILLPASLQGPRLFASSLVVSFPAPQCVFSQLRRLHTGAEVNVLPWVGTNSAGA